VAGKLAAARFKATANNMILRELPGSYWCQGPPSTVIWITACHRQERPLSLYSDSGQVTSVTLPENASESYVRK